MGEKQIFQPLTREDKVTVVLYRAGIVLSCVALAMQAFFPAALPADVPGYVIHLSVGLSVFFIHLYIGKFKTYLIRMYLLALACLAALLLLGKGGLAAGAVMRPFGPLLLLPLAGCLAFVTAKEAFCFKLVEGYLLAMLMPALLVLAAAGALAGSGVPTALMVTAALFILFTLRKVFQPLAWDIGDKTAYR